MGSGLLPLLVGLLVTYCYRVPSVIAIPDRKEQRERRSMTSPRLQAVSREHGREVSASTISRRLSEGGLKARIPRKKAKADTCHDKKNTALIGPCHTRIGYLKTGESTWWIHAGVVCPPRALKPESSRTSTRQDQARRVLYRLARTHTPLALDSPDWLRPLLSLIPSFKKNNTSSIQRQHTLSKLKLSSTIMPDPALREQQCSLYLAVPSSSPPSSYVRMLTTVKHHITGTVKRTVPYNDFYIYVEDDWPVRRSYRVEDFLWTGSGDGQDFILGSSELTSMTVVHTTIFPTPVLTSPHHGPVSPTCCVTGVIRPTSTLGPPLATPRPTLPPVQAPDQRFWLLTVVQMNLTQVTPSQGDLENKLARLYRLAFNRQQEHHLGIGNATAQAILRQRLRRDRDRRVPEPVNVYLHNQSSEGSARLALLYSVHVDGKPVLAYTAAADMKLVSTNEATAELGFPILTKAELDAAVCLKLNFDRVSRADVAQYKESWQSYFKSLRADSIIEVEIWLLCQCGLHTYSSPTASLVLTDSSQLTSDSQRLAYLKDNHPLDGGWKKARSRDTWLLVGSAVAAVALLLLLAVLLALGLGKRKRNKRRVLASSNRRQVFEREAGTANLAYHDEEGNTKVALS
uniref:Transposase Tc1-like domain-containing protein n=1 Tax=Timema douglasi TaxID=61478 RepID=A0A7R8Z9I0_TIMDO|nr:unnamed protein product [Timema douglasi]